MSDVVFILGAGASKESGAPLMNDFLDAAERLYWENPDGRMREHYERVFQGIGYLQRAHSKAELDIVNLESVFAAFDMARLIGRMPGVERSDEIAALVESLSIVIADTLERAMEFPVAKRPSGKLCVQAPRPYPALAELVHKMQYDRRPPLSSAILTFNYDIGADSALDERGLSIGYGLDTDTDGSVPLLKLHGSLSWTYCSDCRELVAWPIREHFSLDDIYADEDSPPAFKLRVRSRMEARPLTHRCSAPLPTIPYIVPPTWNKGQHYEPLARVWGRAAEQLSEARHVFVIGYSLPESDLFFRYLYALGAIGSRPLQTFWVFNPDDSGLTKARFRALLGGGADARFDYIPCTFSNCFKAIADRLGVKY